LSRSGNTVFTYSFWRWGLAGIALASPLFVISLISNGFAYQIRNMDKPILAFVALMMMAGVIYLLVTLGFRQHVLSKSLLVWVILLGLLARISMSASTPILEDDYYRYLWDGGVVARGFNPYQYAPRDILVGGKIDLPHHLTELALEAKPILERVNYPRLRSPYPPISQCAFALAHMIRPWSMTAWRTVLLLLDLATLYLLFNLLRNLNLPLQGLVIYWWNPLLIKEIYNSGHMELVLFPFLLGFVLLLIRHRYVYASGILGLAVGVRFWPALLLPVVVRNHWGEPKRLMPAVILFAGLSVVMVLPFYQAHFDSSSGLRAYASYWEMNDTLFMVILWAVKFILGVDGQDVGYAQITARVVTTGILFMVILWVVKRSNQDPPEMVRRCTLIIAALFLLSPTQFPWYALWMLPFLAICPRASLLILTALLPLYYVRFYLSARGMAEIFDKGIVWLEFGPVWLLLIWEWYTSRRGAGTMPNLR
jgi:alpha-1,6-mannosyltransferase